MSDSQVDIIVIGAGIAGASVAAECASFASVLLLEMESHPGSHSTGRSAAFFAPSYGNETVRGLTAASEVFYRAPPAEYFNGDILRPRDHVFVARKEQAASLVDLQQEVPSLVREDPRHLEAQLQIVQPDYLDGVLRDSSGADLDVDLALQGYLRMFRARGGTLATASEVKQLSRSGGLWRVETNDRSFAATTVVNAAGAWADTIAERANLSGVGIVPKRRTAVLVDPPAGVDIKDWPLVVDADEAFYFKPDAGMLLLSPADETPMPPCDAQADEWDIAVAVERVTQMLDLPVRRVSHRWAGLRCFAPDKTFVAGEDPRAEGFFWLAGQGGYGVQAAPGLALLTSQLVSGTRVSDSNVLQFAQALSPERLL